LFSVLVEVAGDGFTIVVLVSFFSDGGLLTVVSFCSHAAKSAAAIKKADVLSQVGFGRTQREII
jgi:hypothetical protein